ncbi:transcription factor TFIID [Prochlorococcus sp. AH-736-E02]|nr:transcription factor TFIID [Prochlorococcus sp. AH-736-E02]
MKIAVKPDLKSKTFSISKHFILHREKEIVFVSNKFYQKLFIILISLSTFLIFPETPRELENICEGYNSKELCNVW